MCEYCNKENHENSFRGDDGIYFDKKHNKHYLVIEHFRNERNKVEVDYCTKCGRKLMGISNEI